MLQSAGSAFRWKAPAIDLAATSKLKRALDLLGAAAGLFLLAPLLVLVALLIRLDSPGPVLFRQRRTGRNGEIFTVYKFRTMRVLEDGPTIAHATRNDHRTTRLGQLLRRSSIDELPQLLNVLKGEMSLVGPRPHAVAHDEQYAALLANYRQRFRARPGITGLAQVNGLRGEIVDLADMAERVEADLEYIGCWSIGLDIEILVRTLLLGPVHPKAY